MMDYESLLKSFLFAILSFCAYLLHKEWLQNRKEKRESYVEFDTSMKKLRNWAIILFLVLISIVYFFKSFG